MSEDSAVSEDTDIWEGDLLGFKDIGDTYTNLIQSVDDTKVISIEAGFGRGKTFFRTRWAEYLRAQGEVVIEIDAQKSDHSGDPVVTFLGALVAALPRVEKGKGKQALDAGLKYASLGAKLVGGMVARSGVDELGEMLTESALDKLEDFDALDEVVKDLGQGMSKAAGKMIAAQMAAEKVRKEEMPDQLRALREVLTADAETERVVILIDELDRCHPEYAISLLEAMKLVFDQPGYVFVLMVNKDYLEGVAAHRFGQAVNGEQYLDKFVDIRLGLPATEQVLGDAAAMIADDLPLNIPFGDGPEFSVERASALAKSIVEEHEPSIRQIERAVLQVDVALRCYRDQPLDCALLLGLAFEDVLGIKVSKLQLSRRQLTPDKAQSFLERIRAEEVDGTRTQSARPDAIEFIRENCKELGDLPDDRYSPLDRPNYYPWFKALSFLAPHYIESHKGILRAVHKLQIVAKDTEVA